MAETRTPSEIVAEVRARYGEDLFGPPAPGCAVDRYSAAGARIACDAITRELQEQEVAAAPAHLYGCTDGGCIFGHPGGMHTNGGCKCLPSISTMRTYTLTEWCELRDKIRAQAAEVKRLRGLGVPATPPGYELRRNDDLSLDELVARHPETVALEQLAEGLWQLRVFLPTKQHVYVELHTRGRAHIKATVLENP